MTYRGDEAGAEGGVGGWGGWHSENGRLGEVTMLRQSNRLRPTVFAADLPPMGGESKEAARVSGRSCQPNDEQKATVAARAPQMAANDRGTQGSKGMH